MQHQSSSATRKRARRRAGRLLASIAAVGISVAVGACGSSSSSPSSSAPASSASASGSAAVAAATAALQQFKATPTKINITTPLKTAPPAGKTVVVLGTPLPQNVEVQKTIQMLANMVHWNYSEVSYDPANPATFNSAVDTALAKHADYLVEAGTPLTPSVMQKAKAAGAKFALASVYPATVQPPVIAVSDSYAQDAVMGKIVAKYFVADSGGKGNAVLEHVPAYPILGGFTDAFTSEVKSTCAGCKVTMANVTIPELAAGKLASTVVSALKQNPSANYLVFDDGPFAAGINSALNAAGLSKVKVIGEAGDAANLQALRTGTQLAWTGYSAAYETYQDMDAMLRDAEGMSIPVAQEGVQPTQLLTKDNVGSTTDWNFPTDALEQFKALWKVSA